MATISLPANGWTPRPYQLGAWRALRNPKIKTIALAWARRHGKDEVAMHATAIKAMERVGNYYHCLPEYGQARKAIWEARNPHTGKIRWREAFPDEIIKKVDNQSMMVTFVNDSTWQLIGSDNTDSLMGASPAGIVFSEAALGNPTAFAFFRPILLENGGWSCHVSSTRGKNHFYNLFQSLKGRDDAYASHISAADTTVFSKEALRMERLDYIQQFGQTIGESLFEQEYMSSWDAAVVGSVFGKELKAMEQEGRMVPLLYDRRFPVDTSWDLGVSDETVVLFWQIIGNTPRLIDWYSASNAGLHHFAEVLTSKPYLYRHHYGPHDINVREWGNNAVSRKSQAKQLGINFTVTPSLPKSEQIAAASNLLSRMYINVHDEQPLDPYEDCAFVVDAWKNYRFNYDRERRILSKTPVHDWTSHYADALMVMAIHQAGNKGVYTPISVDEHQNFNTTRLRHMLAARQRTNGAWG